MGNKFTFLVYCSKVGQNQALKYHSERKGIRHAFTGSVNFARLSKQQLDIFSRTEVVMFSATKTRNENIILSQNNIY